MSFKLEFRRVKFNSGNDFKCLEFAKILFLSQDSVRRIRGGLWSILFRFMGTLFKAFKILLKNWNSYWKYKARSCDNYIGTNISKACKVRADTIEVLDAIRTIVRALRVSTRAYEKTCGLNGAQIFILHQIHISSKERSFSFLGKTLVLFCLLKLDTPVSKGDRIHRFTGIRGTVFTTLQ